MYRSRHWRSLCALLTLAGASLLISACDSGNDAAALPAGKAAAAKLQPMQPAVPCESLADFDLAAIGGEGSRVTSARPADDGTAACELEGRLAPEIDFKLRLPTENWTQRYLQVGCGGLCGMINLNVGAAEGCAPLEAGEFAIASTNMGHSGMGGAFGADPQKRIDFAYRGVHLTAVAAKALIEAFYGKAPAYSYFTGCSDGGREALVEAQRYPQDFDGIIAGAPAMNFSVQNSFYHAWQARSNSDANGEAILTRDRLPILHRAALGACDKLDGLEDGLITDPRRCDFDPAVAQCEDGETGGKCLSAAEVAAAKKLYRGPVDPDTGRALTLGGPQPGSELSWAGVFVPRSGPRGIFSERIALDALANLIYEQNPEASYRLDDFAFTEASFDQIRPLNGLYSGTNPELGDFRTAGGKLILWHGWSDPHISPINTIAYFQAVEKLLGKEATDGFMKLFLFPGMYHCSGGYGPSRMDLLTPMMQWVEEGRAPQMIIVEAGAEPKRGNHREGQAKMGAPEHGPAMQEEPVEVVERTRPVYPYRQVATYSGSGSPDDAANFKPAPGERGPETYDWAGSDFYAPKRQLNCSVVDGELTCSGLNRAKQ